MGDFEICISVLMSNEYGSLWSALCHRHPAQVAQNAISGIESIEQSLIYHHQAQEATKVM